MNDTALCSFCLEIFKKHRLPNKSVHGAHFLETELAEEWL